MKFLRKTIALLLVLAVISSAASITVFAEENEDVQKIVLSSIESGGSYTHSATLNGAAVPEYDYVWHADPSTAHEDVKNSPAEYYTGTEPSGEDAVYIAHDIIYYPELDQSKFQQVNYDGEAEWAYMYEAEGYERYIFSTLPVQRTGFPSHMMHSEAEAYQNAVLHITQPGTYEIEGQWHGQIWVDLGDEEDVYADPTQKVTLILGGVDITCTVAPGVVFYSVYECDNAWEDAQSYSHNVDTSDAGANVVLAEGSVNHVSGTNVFRILKTKLKDEDSADAYPAQKKSWKIDGAFYSYQSMNISGTGALNITAGFEGLDSEHHLTLNSGNVNIYSQDDGINVNEDGVSVLTVNGGNLHICAGLGAEGDGIDSNGYLVINGGTVITMANPASDSGLDSDFGSFVNGGTVVALGSTMDWAESDDSSNSAQPVLNLRLGASQSADEAIVITDTDGKVVFAYDPDKDETAKGNLRTYQGAIISAPSLEIGGSYYIYIGGDVEGANESGIYDISTVTGFTGSVQQGYSGNMAGGFGGGSRPSGMQDMFGNGENIPDMPDGMQGPTGGDGSIPDMPDGMQNPNGGDGSIPGMPDGMQNPNGGDGNAPEMPNGMQKPAGDGNAQIPNGDFDQGQMQRPGDRDFWGSNTDATCTYERVFTLSAQMNAFSGVADYAHALTKVEAQEAQYGQNGTKEHYVCSGCGKRFADESASVELTADEVSIASKDHTILIAGVFFLGFAFLAAAVVGMIVLGKKKKA